MAFLNPPVYNRACAATAGGIARVWLFDGNDFDFTQTAPASGSTAVMPYSAVALATGATALSGAKMYPIAFEKKTAEHTFKQSKKGSSSKYEHQLEFKLPDISQMITNWNKAVDDIGVCGGLGIAIQYNSGKIFIAGERIVNGLPVDVPMDMVQDGSSGTSGKLMDDENAETVILKGDYPRKLYEFTGGVASLISMQ